MKLLKWFFSVPLLFSFWHGVFSFMPNFVSLLPQQFPLATSQQNPFTTRNAWVFFRNSWAFGLSCVLPLWHWKPKNFSMGSWHIRLLRKNFTPGTVNRKRTSSTNDFTAKEGKVHYLKLMNTSVHTSVHVRCLCVCTIIVLCIWHCTNL